MNTLGSMSTQTASMSTTLGTTHQIAATGGKHATVLSYAGDPRVVRADVMMARHRIDADRDENRGRQQRTVRSESMVNEDDIDEVDDSEWDEVADVICAGRGRLGVAVAAAAQRRGLDVMLADAPGAATDECAGQLAGLLGITDEETVAYLAALTEDITLLPGTDPTIPMRVVDGPLPRELPRRPIGTFYGAALMHWAESCVASPYGLLYTRVADPGLSVPYAGPNGSVEATVLGTINIDPLRPADGVEHWLSALETENEGAFHPAGSLQRLVFENGVVVGAVVESASGVRTVRARHGVMLAFGDGVPLSAQTADLEPRQSAEVALVSRAASRFARLELLTRAED